MKETLLKRLANLLSVKSIATLILTLIFSYLSIVGIIDGDKFMTIYSVVIAFYFGTQTQKINDYIGKNNKEE